MSYEYLEINGVKVPLPLSAFPIGSIYMSVSDVSPASFIGGTWERIKDKFLLSAGDTYAGGSTGGSADVNIDIENLPANFKFAITSGSGGVNSDGYTIQHGLIGAADVRHMELTLLNPSTNVAVTNSPIPTMPPYLAVYMWKRTA